MTVQRVPWIAAAMTATLWLTPVALDAKLAKSDSTTSQAKAAAPTAKATTAASSSAPSKSVSQTAKSTDSKPAAPATKAKAKASPAKTAAAPKAEDTTPAPPNPGKSAAKPKMTLPAGQEGTAFGSLTVEGEDRIRIEFERPPLDLQLDPRQSPGLELGDSQEILDREKPELVRPYLQTSALVRTPYQGRPWLDEMTTGPVARFHPAVTGVERWRLAVVDSRGEQVVEFKGTGSPPKEIEWNGLNATGKPCQPGLTYSYVFEAFDRAGNKRNFVGDGFQLPSYRRETPQALVLLFAGERLGGPAANRPGTAPAPIVLEAASWINQSPRTQQPIQVKATARSFEVANALSQTLVQQLGSLVIGDPARIQAQSAVEPDAPPQGSVAITIAP